MRAWPPLLLLASLGCGGAVAGPADALLTEARAYEHGEGVPKDEGRALRLYCEGARQGDAEAQYSLGWMYANGRGVLRDDPSAAYFFARAAWQGHAQARRMLAYVGEPAPRAPDCLFRPDDGGRAEEGEIFTPRTPAQKEVVDLVQKLAPQYGISPRLALAVIRAESNFNSGAVSGRNAQGLMQLIPETSARFKVAKPFDPEQNIRGGLAYLRWLLAYFQGNVALVAAAYNAGEGAVNRFRGIPPFAETRSYVKRIRKLFARDEHPYDRSVTDPSPELPRIRVNG
ncbi:MAG: Lytic transglycosylase catalytic [Rhodocyclaceae bacterium]|nr:Lytic transglycosylase catalytic [Rhodocyclaceae bacterium]